MVKKTGNASAAQRGAAVAFALACSGVNMFSLQYHTVAVSATTHIPLYVNSDAYRRHRSSYYNGELISGEGDGYLVVFSLFPAGVRYGVAYLFELMRGFRSTFNVSHAVNHIITYHAE